MTKQPRGKNPLRKYALLVMGILAVSGAVVGPRLQAWYKTVPQKEAYAVAMGLICGMIILLYAIGLIIVSRSSDS
jgi:hypothetical protein